METYYSLQSPAKMQKWHYAPAKRQREGLQGKEESEKKILIKKKKISTLRMNFPSPSSSFFEHSKQLAFYIYAQMRLSLWVQSPEKAEAYSLGCQRKQLLARFSCPGNRYSSRSFGLTAKANICITFIFPSSLPH